MSFFNYREVAHTDHAQMEKLYQLRFKVYCEECGYEASCDYQDGRETDIYDPFSAHISAAETTTGDVVGTVRIINQSELGLPITNHFKIKPDLFSNGNSLKVAEVSRLAMSKEYRLQAVTNAIRNKKIINIADRRYRDDWRKQFQDDLVCGIYCEIYEYCLTNRITHIYAAMADSLYKILTNWGLCFEQIGDPIDYHGIRAPYVASVAKNFEWYQERQEFKVRQQVPVEPARVWI